MNVIIIGRENVGKSTLFNRLIGQHKALISSEAGTTRDNKFGTVLWADTSFTLVDTAGINVDTDTKIGKQVREKINDALDLADIVLFVVDGQTGIISQDREIAKIIREQNKPFMLLVNKIDKPRDESAGAEFMQLGMGQPFFVSAKSSLGVGDMLDEVIHHIETIDASKKEDERYLIEKDTLKICLIGQPNVGKSSLLNAILGEEKVIVTDVPNTTREPNDIPFTYKERDIVLIDTAGIRRKRQKRTLDALSMKQSMKTIKESDVVLLVLDASKPLTVQDQRLAGYALEMQKGVILLVNKWDLVEDKDTNTINEYKMSIQAMLPFLKGAPFLFVSATEKQRVNKILDLAFTAWDEMHRVIKPKELERFLKRIIKKQRPRAIKRAFKPHIFKIEQTGTNPPWFVVHIRRKDTLHTSYIRFIENQLREEYGFVGAPLKVSTRKRTKKENVAIAKMKKERDEREKAERLERELFEWNEPHEEIIENNTDAAVQQAPDIEKID